MKYLTASRQVPAALACWLRTACFNPLHAQGVATIEERVSRLEAAGGHAASINTGDNAWLLASSALVLMMTAPGLILFYGGLVRRKNVLAAMMHSLILMALVCALMLGKRIGFPSEPMPPHNVVLSLIGAGLLWVGWFGFNAGSAYND